MVTPSSPEKNSARSRPAPPRRFPPPKSTAKALGVSSFLERKLGRTDTQPAAHGICHQAASKRTRLPLRAWTCALAAVLTAALPSGSLAEPTAGQWTFIDNDDGIETWKLEVPGKDLPGFRGEVLIAASIDTIMQEMLDSEHHPDWMYRCAESTVLRDVDEDRALVYNRTTAPWPVWDRDVILDTRYQRSDKALKLTFKNVKSDLRPTPEKVVRMPLLEGSYVLTEIAPNKTRIVYEVEADIGGSIPKWIAKRASKDLPYITLSKLRERVLERTRALNAKPQ